jgi:hypothetical protein
MELIEKIKALPKAERERVAEFVAQLDASAQQPQRDRHDLAILNDRAESLNREAADVLDYQVSL